MRVLLDVTCARRAPYSGIAIYLERLQDALSRIPGVEVIARANRHSRLPAGGGPPGARSLAVDRWWTGTELPKLARELDADVIHHPLPAIARKLAVPQVITVHDLAFEQLPRQFDRKFRLYAHFAHRAAARRARAVICVSEATATEVAERWRLPREQIVVARPGPGQRLPRAPGKRPSHFLYVGDDEPHKNLATLLAAYASYRAADSKPLELVLAGCGIAEAPGVRTERSPSAQRLAELYAAAAALVQPSLHEGFGLTALEAMHAGVPVIAARIAGLEELCGDAARYAHPRDPESFAQAMAEVASKPALRAELWQRGRRRAARFTWEASARAHVAAYSLALK